MKNIVTLIGLLMLSAISAAQANQATFDCEAQKGKTISAIPFYVSDGDTANFKTEYGIVDVRYWGVDTPESEWPGRWPAQAYSADAKRYNQKQLGNGKDEGTVTIHFTGDKTYKRCVGEVFVNGKSLSLGLIENGYGWWNAKYAPSYVELKQAQAKAMNSKKGLWSDENPETPWDYRRRHPKK